MNNQMHTETALTASPAAEAQAVECHARLPNFAAANKPPTVDALVSPFPQRLTCDCGTARQSNAGGSGASIPSLHAGVPP